MEAAGDATSPEEEEASPRVLDLHGAHLGMQSDEEPPNPATTATIEQGPVPPELVRGKRRELSQYIRGVILAQY